LTVSALVIASFLVVLVVNSSSLVSPPLAAGGNGNGPGTPQGGILRVTLRTNQPKGDAFSPPNRDFYGVSGKPIDVVNPTDITDPTLIFTDANGMVLTRLSAGPYTVQLDEETLHISIPVTITDGDETRLNIVVTGTQYPVSYSETSATGSSPYAGENVVYLQLRSSHTVAGLNSTVVLKVASGATGEMVNGTVVGSQQSGQASWLQVVTPGALEANGASGMAVVVFDGTDTIDTQPIGTVVDLTS